LRLWTKNEREATDNVRKILGVRPSIRAFGPRKRRAPLSITDLLIMDALVDDPKVSFGDLLKSTGLSPKTVRKHLNLLLERKTISIDPLLGALTDSGALIYPLAIVGRVSLDEVRRIMGESALTHYTLEPPMKHVLCRASSLADVITKTRVLEKVQGVQSVTITLNREANPDMKNFYDGMVKLDGKGEAVIELPDWFGAFNKDFRYQLTAIGAPGPNLHIAEGIKNHRFKIAGGSSGMKVSWQVTGVRNDPYSRANPIQIEEDKSDNERGLYIHPEVYGQAAEKRISLDNLRKDKVAPK
jgi:DNA-binding Lrp family transcriptional regulator